MSAVLNNDIDFSCEYKNIIDDSKDWLQALWQYYEADRTEKKQDYTPKSLCKLVASLAGKADTVYDCCGGSGALTKAFIDMHGAKNVLVEELDERVIPFLLFNMTLRNIRCRVFQMNALTGDDAVRAWDILKGETFGNITDFKPTV
jgi:type I restriction enzyme M protein